jgi:peptidyl-prolyl cis-trans isomerase SurA
LKTPHAFPPVRSRHRERAAIALIVLAALARAEIIDRIAVSVGSSVVTTSDIDREIRVVAFQQQATPDFSPADRRATADRMVEQRLIFRDLENSRYPTPSDTDVEPQFAQFRRTFYPTAEAFGQALAKYGITENDFKEELIRQRALLLFIEVRFRPGVQVSEQEIEDYFHSTVEPAARAAHPDDMPTLEAYHDKIEETLIGHRQDQQLNDWLKQARARVDVVYHEEAFQ